MGKKYAVRGELSEERRAKIRESLLRAAGDEKTTLVSEQDVLHLVGAKPHEFGAVLQQLDQLEAEGALVRNKKGRYLLPETYDLFAGTLRGHRRGFAFVSLDNGSQDVYIPRSSVGNAIDGDRVLIRLFSETHGDHRTGSVEKILSRGVTFVTGTYAPERSFGFVITDGKFLPDVYVPQEDAMGARRGDKVKVRITKYPDEVSGLRGEVTEIFGAAGDSRAETEAVIARYDVRTEFPESVCGEAAGAPQKVTKKDRQGREDLREKTLITIDGADARDFDDAVRVERKENGSYLLYVCIADVAEYVTEGSPLDKEALARGCSVYFPNRVCPMLPAELSNGICSLNEGEDRLTLTAEMEISEAGEVVTYRIYESVIRSAARMIYTDVSDILEESDLSESADFSESAGDSAGPEDGNAVQKRAEVREKREAKESLKEKYRDCMLTVRMVEMLGADGVIISQEGFGNPTTDLMLVCQGLEKRGIKTVIITNEDAGVDGMSESLPDSVTEADAIVSTGNSNATIMLPKMEKTIGVLSDVAKTTGGNVDSIQDDGRLLIEIHGIMGGHNLQGNTYLGAITI